MNKYSSRYLSFQMRFCRSSLDKRMVIPQLIQKQKKEVRAKKSDNKENSKGQKKGM